mgnify:CR=1 FL=1
MQRLTLSLLALLAATPALAQSGDVELDEIVVTANRTALALNRTGSSVTVIGPDALARGSWGVVDGDRTWGWHAGHGPRHDRGDARLRDTCPGRERLG